MQCNWRLGRALGDAGMAEFVRRLEHQCAWYGTAFEKMDRRYPSSKTCKPCGAVKPSLLLSTRTCRCLPCGFAGDRDGNAARNLQTFIPAARSAGTNAETRKSSRHLGLQGRRSIAARFRLMQEVEMAMGSGDRDLVAKMADGRTAILADARNRK